MLAGGMAQYCRSADHPCATPGDALLEVKTDFSNTNTRAGRRICDTRAEQVPGEYQRRAASCDRRWGVGRAFRDRLAATKLLPVAFDRYGGCSKSMEELVRIMSAAGAERLAGKYGVSAGVLSCLVLLELMPQVSLHGLQSGKWPGSTMRTWRSLHGRATIR